MIIIKYRKSAEKNKHSILKEMKGSGSEKRLRILETMSMGERRSIALIQFENRILLIGNAPGRISLLSSFFGEITPISESDEGRVPPDEKSFRKQYRIFTHYFESRNKCRMATAKQGKQPDVRAKMEFIREALEK